MKNFAKLTLVWVGSFVFALGFVYGAGTLIKTLTQTAQKGDIVTSEWVNAVNTKLSQDVNASSGGGVSCAGDQYGITCVRADGTCRYNRNTSIRSTVNQEGWITCRNAFTNK